MTVGERTGKKIALSFIKVSLILYLLCLLEKLNENRRKEETLSFQIGISNLSQMRLAQSLEKLNNSFEYRLKRTIFEW